MCSLGKTLCCFKVSVPVHKVGSIKRLFFKFGEEELDWPARNPDLNSTVRVQNLVESLPRNVEAVIAAY